MAKGGSAALMEHTEPKRGSYWRHCARGTVYRVVCVAQGQGASIEGGRLVVYRNDVLRPGAAVWARPVAEFMDGRFEAVFRS